MNRFIKLLFFISRVLFPNENSFFFPFYMFIIFIKVAKQQTIFRLVPVPHKLFVKCFDCPELNVSDYNNSVLISKNRADKFTDCIYLCDKVKKIKRLVFFACCSIPDDVIYINECLFNNLKVCGMNTFVQIKLAKFCNIPVASEADISLVCSQIDLNNSVIDCLLKNYFKTLKIVSENDIISVDVRENAPEYFYTNCKVNNSEIIYFKCNKVLSKTERSEEKCVFCVYGETTVKQSANVQSFVPVRDKILRYRQFNDICKIDSYVINQCPFGLEKYVQEIEKAMKPFLTQKCTLLQPVFLVYGHGSLSQETVIVSLALKQGLHLYRVTSTDLISNVYSQSETKIKNTFFKAKLCSPCMLVIDHFESFGKNNEGQYDKRIVDFFETEVNNLFTNQNFPLFLFCLCGTKEIPAELWRIFLETFEVSHLEQNERELNLKWIMQLHDLGHKFDVNDVALKTQGFLFEDLVMLILRAKRIAKGNSMLASDDIEKALELMQKDYSKSLGTPEIPKVQWADVGGLNDVKSEIMRTINLPLKFAELFQMSGFKRSGILLYGPPGTGKTLIAKAVATECNLCFLSVKGPELLNMYVGQSEQNIREVFEKARQASPCIIFFDELDSLAPNRGNSGDSGGVMDRIVSQLLAEMDGLNQAGFVFIIGATNRPDLIDPALLRPGRFDKLVYVGPCSDKQSQLSVLKALTRRFKLAADVDFEDLLNLCPSNVSGADFYGLASSAWMSAARRLIQSKQADNPKSLSATDVTVNMEDFKTALKTLKPSLNPEDMLYYEALKRKFV